MQPLKTITIPINTPTPVQIDFGFDIGQHPDFLIEVPLQDGTGTTDSPNITISRVRNAAGDITALYVNAQPSEFGTTTEQIIITLK